jgi:hypothetical protein
VGRMMLGAHARSPRVPTPAESACMSLMRCRSRLACAVLVIATVVSTDSILAQGREPLTQPATIPTELAASLIETGGITGTDAPRILVGSAPEWVMTRIVVPNGAHVLGAAMAGASVVTIVTIPFASDTVVGELRAALLTHGWKPVPVVQQPNFGGFRSAPVVASGPVTRVTLCDGAQTLTTSLVHRDLQSTDIAYRMSAAGVGVCNPPQMQLPVNFRPPPWPTLFNPAGSIDARIVGECSGPINGSTSTNTTLRTAMPSDSILSNYERQLSDSGWKVTSGSESLTGRTFVRPDSSGAPIEVALTVTSRAGSCRDVIMQVRTLKKP